MITKKDLTGIGDDDYGNRQDEHMQCSRCEFVSGGTRGDYWAMPEDEAFICPECHSLMMLVREVRTMEIVKQ